MLRDGEVAGACPVAGVSRDGPRADDGRPRRAAAFRSHGARAPGTERLAVVDLHGRRRRRASSGSAASASRCERARSSPSPASTATARRSSPTSSAGSPRRARGRSTSTADMNDPASPCSREAGFECIPADRAIRIIVADMTLAENLALRDFGTPPFRRGPWLEARAITRGRHRAHRPLQRPAPTGRERAGAHALGRQPAEDRRRARDRPRIHASCWPCSPRAASTPARRASSWSRSSRCADAGAGVLYISTELDEVLAVADQIGVMHGGRLVGVMSRDGRRSHARSGS